MHNRIIVGFTCCLLLLFPYTVSAEDSPVDKGKMEWKTDQILENDADEEYQHTKTEMEKRIPHLFDEKTQAKMESIQKEKEQTNEALEEALFTTSLEQDTTIDDTREALFPSDYAAPESSDKHEKEAEEESSWFNTLLMVGLTGIGVIVLGGVYVLFRKLSD